MQSDRDWTVAREGEAMGSERGSCLAAILPIRAYRQEGTCEAGMLTSRRQPSPPLVFAEGSLAGA